MDQQTTLGEFNDSDPQMKALNDIVEMAEDGRLNRSLTRPVKFVKWTAKTFSWNGTAQGQQGQTYRPRVRVMNGRTFGCTCPDHHKTRGAKGPCKHVISLAQCVIAIKVDDFLMGTNH